ncbi:hypothetical protein [Desulfocurvus sp. DL9XJH121]
MIIVTGQQVTDIREMSPGFRSLTELLGGVDWLLWALAEPRLIMAARDEADLLCMIQVGLNGVPLAVLDSLDMAAHPARLMLLPDKTAAQAAAAVAGGLPRDLAAARKALRAEGLRTFKDLACGSGLVEELGVRDSALFAAMGLGDLLVLADLAADVRAGKLPCAGEEDLVLAAGFAVDRARSCAEFCDALRFFCQEAEYGDAAARWESRTPLAYRFLETMAVDPDLAADELPLAVEALALQERLGFATPARALRVLQGRVAGDAGPEQWIEAAREELRDAQCLIRRNNFQGQALSQDGAAVSLAYGTKTAGLRLECAADGLVTVAQLH